TDAATNAFLNPTRTQTFDNNVGTTTVTFKSTTGNLIGASITQKNHFGIEGNGKKPRKIITQWSYDSEVFLITAPDPDYEFTYFPDTLSLRIVLQNNTQDTTTVTNAGYLLSSGELPIEDLNSSVLPPSSFVPLPSFFNTTYMPGESQTTTLTGVTANSFIT